MNRKILPSITTIGLTASSWRDKVLEIKPLALRELALFVTAIGDEERQECFALLAEVKSAWPFEIPFVHATNTMREEEYVQLVNEFGTQRFNLHPERALPLQHRLSNQIRSRIFIENSGPRVALRPGDLQGYAGICLDVSHLSDLILLHPEEGEKMAELLNAYPIGANHLSGVPPVLEEPLDVQMQEGNQNPLRHPGLSVHVAQGAADYDYLLRFPQRYYSELCAIELENSLEEQLELLPEIAARIANALR